MVNDLISFYDPGADLNGQAAEAVIGKRCLRITGPRNGPELNTSGEGGRIPVGHAVAGGRICGVASWDAAVGRDVNVVRGKVVPIRAAAAIAAFAEVEVGADGQVIPIDRVARPNSVAIGYAIDDAAINTDAQISLYV